MARTAKTQILQVQYERSPHEKLAEIADPLALQAEQELLKQGYRNTDIRFAVKLHMRSGSGGPTIPIDAITFDPSYDFDAEFEQWKNSKSTGYQRFSEMPGDVAFRIRGKSQGSFNGGWIGLRFKWRFEEETGTEPGADVIVEAITVKAWTEEVASPGNSPSSVTRSGGG
ncbi:MAG TPA: hypothetical protein VM782_03820 [Stellaceae bacterium]|nr:hypothetical protein [Stellaceae bacterium]